MGNRIVVCPYCLAGAELVKGGVIYGGARFDDRNFYLCRSCWAYVGTHKGTTVPLGSLANAELRDWRKKAHAAIDPLWRDQENSKLARVEIYAKLAELLGIKPAEAHVAEFDLVRCRKVVGLVDLAKEVGAAGDQGITPEEAFQRMAKDWGQEIREAETSGRVSVEEKKDSTTVWAHDQVQEKKKTVGGFRCGPGGCKPFLGDRKGGSGAGD